MTVGRIAERGRKVRELLRASDEGPCERPLRDRKLHVLHRPLRHRRKSRPNRPSWAAPFAGSLGPAAASRSMSSTPRTQPSTGTVTSGRRRSTLWIGAIVAAALAAAIVTWLVVGRGSGSVTTRFASTTTLPGTVPTSRLARPAIASAGRLRAAVAASRVPVYWAGVRRGTKLELTRAPGGTVYVRYLPPGAAAGDTRPFLTVATYPRPKAYAEVRHAAASAKSKTIDLAGGGIAVYDPGRPTNVHIAYPGQPYQIEVFVPAGSAAVRLVESGAVRPVG